MIRGSLFVLSLCVIFNMTACKEQPPQGKWLATKRIEVHKEKFHPMTIFFYVEQGEVCALGDKWHPDKDLAYKEIVCSKGRGWITDDTHFKKLSD